MFTRVPMIRLMILLGGLATTLIVVVVSFQRSHPFHSFQVADDIERILIQAECSPRPLSISSLPFMPAVPLDATVQALARPQLHCRPRTPLFVGFSENVPLLAQAVLSYIACGWPGSDIIVVDNTGVLEVDTKNNGSIDYEKLRRQYGVNILQAPTQLSFSQLQNFYISTARLQGWQYFFWTHMDVVALSHPSPSPSLYQQVISSLENITAPESSSNWAFGWYHYDNLCLVNVLATPSIGPWDIDIPYYPSDCDYYTRTRLRGFQIHDFDVGHIFDVGAVLPDAHHALFHASYDELLPQLTELEERKKRDRGRPGFWQGWDRAREVTVDAGRRVYKRKWGTESYHPRIGPA